MMAAEGVALHREIPRGLGTFRDKEAKALAFMLSGTLTILTEQQPHRLLATLLSSMPAVYLLTLHGTLLCAVLSAIFFELLRNWAPASDEICRGAAAPPEGASPVLDVSGIDTPGDPQQTAGVRAAEPSRNTSLGEKFLEGEPKLLGVVLLTTSFGTILLSMPDLVLRRIESVHLGLVWWSFVHSLVSGVLAVVAAGNPSLVLIRSCFVLSVLSAVVSSIVSLAYVDMTNFIYFCYIQECENSTVFTQHIFPFLLLLLTVVLCSVLAAYARKALRPLSLDKATLIVNPTPVQERSGHPALQE